MTAEAPLQRFKLSLHYDGTDFHGWQIQAVERTVQGDLEAALTRLTGARRPVVGSGRTDAGVHAVGQVASVDLPPRWTARELRRALNAVLPGDVWVSEARTVRRDFHPRYHATRRTYVYRLGLEPEAHGPFYRRRCWPVEEEVDGALLDAAAAALPGTRSFQAFAKAGQPERGYLCAVEEARWEGWSLGSQLRIAADRYLHHMVRYLVGTMVDVARGRRPLEEMEALLRDPAGPERTSPPAPPQGLFLARVEYPPEVEPPSPDGQAAGVDPRSRPFLP